jgi:hypothetical protein
MTKEIEVIDRYNARYRFPADTHHYQWRLKPGSIDVEGSEFLDILRVCDDDEDAMEPVCTFAQPARVGIVDESALQIPPMRELSLEQCPRCGFKRTDPRQENIYLEPVTRIDQISKGDQLVIFDGEKITMAEAQQVKVTNHDGTEVIFNLRKNKYFNLGWHLEGRSWAKDIKIIRAPTGVY